MNTSSYKTMAHYTNYKATKFKILYLHHLSMCWMYNELHVHYAVYSYATLDLGAMCHKRTRSTRIYSVKNSSDTSCSYCTNVTRSVRRKLRVHGRVWITFNVTNKKGLYMHECTKVNRLTPELNPSAQRCLTRCFTLDFAS
jgi:hypothetical protein